MPGKRRGAPSACRWWRRSSASVCAAWLSAPALRSLAHSDTIQNVTPNEHICLILVLYSVQCRVHMEKSHRIVLAKTSDIYVNKEKF